MIMQMYETNPEEKKNSGKDEGEDEKKDADFETAIKATGFGKFNFLLIALILPCASSQVFEASNMSFVLPIAECDLKLSLDDKGKLNAISFAGMISSGFIWGYLCDRLGRRKIMFYGYLLHLCSMLMASLSQSFSVLMAAKFFGGLIVNGPTSATTSMLAELHSSNFRAKIQLIRGVLVAFSNILLPLLAWAILPREINFSLFGLFDIHSWNVLLLICAIPPLLSCLLMTFVPESPKFLMTKGKNEEAMNVFRRIYRINTGKSEESFPIKNLVKENIRISKIERSSEFPEDRTSMGRKFVETLKPLFIRPYVFRLILACSNALLVLMSANTLKFWQPQLLQAINDYKQLNNGSSSNMCDMLDVMVPKNKTLLESTSCFVNLDNDSVYINSILISVGQAVTFALAGTVVNKIGKKTLVAVSSLTAFACSTSVLFAPNSSILIMLFTIFTAATGLARNVSMTITLEMFPTVARTTALSLHMMSARTGSVVGNLAMPDLLKAGCLPPFLFIGMAILGSACLAGLFTNTEGKALK